jgi:diguanylate cyclase (GGDEF)-like protein
MALQLVPDDPMASEAASRRAIDVLPDPLQARTRVHRGWRSAHLRHPAEATTEALPADDAVVVAAAPEPVVAAVAASPSPTDLIPSQPLGTPDLQPTAVSESIDRDGLLTHVSEALQTHAPLALVQIGLDHFRELNASAGPAAGDVALHRASGVLAWAFAPHQVTRVDGDCFAVLLPDGDLPSVEKKVEVALSLVAGTDLSEDRSGVRTTASAGITMLDRSPFAPDGELLAGAGEIAPGDLLPAEGPPVIAADVLLEADIAMAAAKQEGRNRLAVHRPVRMSEPAAAVSC